jgi:hypothetical protein
MRQWVSAGDAKEWRLVVENHAVPTVVVLYDYVFNTDALKEVLGDIYGELAADDHLLFLLVNMKEVARGALGFDDVQGDSGGDSLGDFLEQDGGTWTKTSDASENAENANREATRVAYSAKWVQVGTRVP